MNRNELVISGLASVRARFQRDPDSMLRLFFDEPTARKIGPMCKALAVQRKVYRCVDPGELEAISGTVHHGGIVAVVKGPVLRAPLPAEVRRWAQEKTPVLLLDRIGNPHNLGAIARTAAYFGVEQVILPFSAEAALPSEAAYRVAEGGLEYVTIWRVGSLSSFIKELAAAGYDVVGAATRGGGVLGSEVRSAATASPLALALGNEEDGLTPETAAACTRTVTLPGRGNVESLNVSVAAAVLMWELFARKARA